MRDSNRLIQSLRSQFAANPSLGTKCRGSSKEKIRTNLTNRVFDEFPLLVSDEELSRLCVTFESIINKGELFRIRPFENSIIEIAYAELFNEKGQLKQELLDLLEWNELSLDNHSVVCAFVGAVNASIFKECESLITQHPDAFTRTTNTISKTYSSLVSEFMRKHGIPYDPIHDRQPSEGNTSSRYLLTASVVGLGLLGLGLALGKSSSGGSSSSFRPTGPK